MSPRTKTITLNLGALIGAIVTVAGMAYGGGSKVVSLADHRYVLNDTFVAFQAGDEIRHVKDSTSVRAELIAIKVYLANLDSSDRCRRNQISYCR